MLSRPAAAAAARVDAVFGVCSIALVTPFAPSNDQPIDVAALERLVAHTAKGVRGGGALIVAGSTGEQHSLSVEERAHLYARAVSCAPENVPIVAGVAACRALDAQRLARAAAAADCAGVMIGLPPYLRPTEEEMAAYVSGVTGELSPGMAALLYDNAARNGGNGMAPETAVALLQEGAVGGIKVGRLTAEGTASAARALVAAAPGVRVYAGSDLAFGEARLAALDGQGPSPYAGLTSVMGNVMPELASRLARGEDREGLATDVNGVRRLTAACVDGWSLPTGIKAALRARGVDCGAPRNPLGIEGPDHARRAEAVEAAVASVLREPRDPQSHSET